LYDVNFSERSTRVDLLTPRGQSIRLSSETIFSPAHFVRRAAEKFFWQQLIKDNRAAVQTSFSSEAQRNDRVSHSGRAQNPKNYPQLWITLVL
jgi:hypothetical protein